KFTASTEEQAGSLGKRAGVVEAAASRTRAEGLLDLRSTEVSEREGYKHDGADLRHTTPPLQEADSPETRGGVQGNQRRHQVGPCRRTETGRCLDGEIGQEVSSGTRRGSTGRGPGSSPPSSTQQLCADNAVACDWHRAVQPVGHGRVRVGAEQVKRRG